MSPVKSEPRIASKTIYKEEWTKSSGLSTELYWYKFLFMKTKMTLSTDLLAYLVIWLCGLHRGSLAHMLEMMTSCNYIIYIVC